jgi:hypothetical protein
MLFDWTAEDRLWFAFFNGMTQNPITSLRMFRQLPSVDHSHGDLAHFSRWFDAQWDTLQFDIDRRYQKKDTVKSIQTYTALVKEHGTQERMLTCKPFSDLWALVTGRYLSFGRLSSFSYLEYVHLNGFGADCDNLLFGDLSGSKSHRNGMMFLLGRDHLVWDPRMPNGFDGKYDNLPQIASELQATAECWLQSFKAQHPSLPGVSQFTLESNLCTFKNHFFGHRYPGIYSDMAWDRITWADARGQQATTEIFKAFRANFLPHWLRAECEAQPMTIKQKAARFTKYGIPFRAEHFLYDA